MKSDLERAASFIDSLNSERMLAFLARLMYELTLAGRASYSVDSLGLEQPRLLREINELQHKVSSQMMNMLSASTNLRSSANLTELFLEPTCEDDSYGRVIRNSFVDAISAMLKE